MAGLASAGLALRSLLWTLLLPGTVAGYLPWWYFGLREARPEWGRPATWACLGMIAFGVTMLLTCVWDFARSGRGTLSPADPPRTLVVRGLYRYVRNPMYIAVTVVVLGEALLSRSTALGAYAAIWFAFVNAFVLGYEEPTLRSTFGAQYDRYCHDVGRWLPRRRTKEADVSRN